MIDSKHSFLAVVLLFILVLPGIVSPQSSSQQNAGGPVETVKTFVAALENADLDAIVGTFSENATMFMPVPLVPKRLTGRQEIRDAFAPLLDNIRAAKTAPPYMTLTPQDLAVQEFGTIAIVTFHLGSPASDKPDAMTSFSRRTFVLQQFNGKWLIVHMHASNMLIPPKPNESSNK